MKTPWSKHKIIGANKHDLCLLPLSIKKDYYVFVSKFSTTNFQYKKYLNETGLPSPEGHNWNGEYWNQIIKPLENDKFNKPNQPIVCISHNDSINYIDWLNNQKSNIKYFLPNSAIWEFATFGRIGDFQIIKQLIFDEKTVFNSPLESHQISQENAFGLKGLIGNIWEWIEPRNRDAFSQNEILALPNESNDISNVVSKLMARDMSHTIGSHILIDKHYRKHKEIRGTSFLDNPFETEPRMNSMFLEDGTKTKHADLGFRIAGLLHKSELPEEILKKVEVFTKSLIEEFKEDYLTPITTIEKYNEEFFSKIKSGKIKDAIEYLSQKMPNNRDLNNALILIEYRYKKNEMNFNSGNITYEEKSVYEVRILNSLIDAFENYANNGYVAKPA